MVSADNVVVVTIACHISFYVMNVKLSSTYNPDYMALVSMAIHTLLVL